MIDAKNALLSLPIGLRGELVDSFREITRNFVERRWEPSELRGGKFAEVAFCVVSGALSGKFPAKANKPRNMADACRVLEASQGDPSRVGDKSLRVLIPRALIFLYDVRNHRGVGHVGGDVDPNAMDAAVVVSVASWVMAEFVRIFHQVTTLEVQQIVDLLSERRVPLVWEVEGVKRVLKPQLSTRDQVLVLLHQSTAWVMVTELQSWVEYQNLTHFRNRIVVPLHTERLAEFDQKSDRVQLTPLGVEDVETRLLPV
jgi:hypothetical protein